MSEEDGRFQLAVCHAQLTKIFDTLKNTQDVYVQLVRVFPDGRECEFARTATCHGGDVNPKWDDESFVVNQSGGKSLKVRVYIEHFWRVDCLCGEADLGFDMLTACTAKGASLVRDLQLAKKGVPTGSLRVSVGCSRAETSCDVAVKVASMSAPVSISQLSPAAYKAELCKLLNRPEELEERVRHRFRQLASSAGERGQLAMRPEDCPRLQQMLSERLGVPSEVFGEINQMFWRFEVAGQGRLYEDEATRMILCMLRQYRDSIEDPKAGRQHLSRTIKTHQVADKYEIIKELGRGGQGIALLAKSSSTNQHVVVKMYGKTNQKEAVEEISQEFELLTSLKHPKIARVFDIFQDWDNVYIVQEPYFGGDLTKAVQNAYNAGIAVDERWVAEVMYQVLMGVEFLHNNGVVHSDLKEPNVMVASHADWRRPQVIVIDFGLANKFSSKSGVGGTPGYMPPEVWDWGLWTPRGDVFSLGVMLFTLRTGKGPFNPDGKSKLEEIKQATKTQEVLMDRGAPQLQSLVHSMIHKKFLHRPLVSQVMKDPWFQSKDLGQALDTQALQNLARQRQRTDLYRALLADVAARQNLAQLKDLNETFLRLDVNNDGRISADELRQGLRGVWKEAEVEQLVNVLGIDGGGEVSYDEFLGELLAAKVPEENALLHRVFTEADVQGRGFLGAEELAELAKRPAIVQILGSPEAALARIRSMDADGSGRVTFEEFKRAVQGGPAVHGQQGFSTGQSVQYWSNSHGIWIPCVVTGVDAASGAVAVDCKPGCWITGEQLHRQLRAAGERQQQQQQCAYRQGQSVLMWSTTYSTWIPCRVTQVDLAKGAVQVDQKPNYWLRGNELATRLKPAPRGGAALQPPAVGGAMPGPAAKAGVGRQLLDGALGAFVDGGGIY